MNDLAMKYLKKEDLVLYGIEGELPVAVGCEFYESDVYEEILIHGWVDERGDFHNYMASDYEDHMWIFPCILPDKDLEAVVDWTTDYFKRLPGNGFKREMVNVQVFLHKETREIRFIELNPRAGLVDDGYFYTSFQRSQYVDMIELLMTGFIDKRTSPWAIQLKERAAGMPYEHCGLYADFKLHNEGYGRDIFDFEYGKQLQKYMVSSFISTYPDRFYPAEELGTIGTVGMGATILMGDRDEEFEIWKRIAKRLVHNWKGPCPLEELLEYRAKKTTLTSSEESD